MAVVVDKSSIRLINLWNVKSTCITKVFSKNIFYIELEITLSETVLCSWRKVCVIVNYCVETKNQPSKWQS